MSSLKNALVKVSTSKGAFGSEFAVAINCSNGQIVSLFADKKEVETSGADSYMRVFVTEKNAHDNIRHVLLPSEAFETSSRWVDVSEALVK